jgi:3-phosphoshikimate 1-carboxyvinyltransferase
MLISAALSGNDSYIECNEVSDDINSTVGCLISLGARIRNDGGGFMVKPVTLPVSDGTVLVNCGDSGSTLRLLLPVCSALGVSAVFLMGGRLYNQPILQISEQLIANGCVCQENRPPVTEPGFAPAAGKVHYSGKLRNGVFTLSGDISSRFICGLLFALPLLDGDSVIKINGREESKPLTDMTIDTLDMFGVKVKRETDDGGGTRYMVAGGQKYISPGTVKVEGDWTNAAVWLCAAAIKGGGVICSGLDRYSRQCDKAVVNILERFGAIVAYRGDSVAVRSANLRSIRIDAADTPGIIPVLSVVAAVAEGQTVVYNAERLLKESRRLSTIESALNALGADVVRNADGLIIRGKPVLSGGTASSSGDHRIAMMAAIASVACENPVAIRDAGVVSKSYPGFFEDFAKLGGEVIMNM